jgi:hypothetical protein
VEEEKEMGGTLSTHDTTENLILENILSGNPEVKTSCWRPRFKWDDNIKLDLKCVCVRVCGYGVKLNG